MTGSKVPCFLAALLCIASTVIAATVSLSSELPLEEVYPGEVIPVKLVVENDSNSAQRVFLAVTSSEEVSLRAEADLTDLDYSLGPGEEILLGIEALTDLRALPGQYSVRVDFGERPEAMNYSNYMNFSLTENPLHISAKLENSAMDELEDNTVNFSLKNLSGEQLTDIQVKLSVSQGLEIGDGELSLGSLAAKASLQNQFISFSSLRESYGRHSLNLRIDFTDSKGRHSINQSFDLKVRNKFNLVAIVVGLIVVLIALNLFTKKKPKPKPKPSPKKEKKEMIKKGTIEVPSLKEVKKEEKETEKKK